MQEKDIIFIGGCARSGTTALTRIISAHQNIIIGIERYNELMKEGQFALTKDHFLKERFFNIQTGDTYYLKNDFLNQSFYKWEEAKYIGVKFPPLDKIYYKLKSVFNNFTFIYIYRNIFDVAESWNRRARDENDLHWPSEKNAYQAVERWNSSLENTYRIIENGHTVIPINYNDLFYSDKPINAIFTKLGIECDDNVNITLANERRKSPKKRLLKSKLSQEEYCYISEHARIDLFDKFDNSFNFIFK